MARAATTHTSLAQPNAAKRFDVALSFAGEQRNFVREVAEYLAVQFGRERVFFDGWYEAELNGLDGGDQLQLIYGVHTRLVVVFLSTDYERKIWPGGVEWRAIKARMRDRVKQSRHALYLCRFDRVTVAGLFEEADIFTDCQGSAFPNGKSASAVAKLICEKHALLLTDTSKPGDVRFVNAGPFRIDPPPPATVSPFYTRAMMPSDHPSYVERDTDHTFANLLRDPKTPCIAINGHSEMGKSSLMNRAARILGPDWNVVSVNLADLRADKVEGSVDRFLGFFRGAFGELGSITQLAERVAEQPVLVLIDEFGMMAAPGARILLPDLLERVDNAGGNLRVVATLIEGIGHFLNERGVGSRRHYRVWKSLTVEPFKDPEARRLLALLPDIPRAVTERMFSEIRKRSALEPRRLQCLADHLWRAHRDGVDDAHLAALVSRADSYE